MPKKDKGRFLEWLINTDHDVYLFYVAFVVDNAIMNSIPYFLKSCIVFCAKAKEVDPIKFISLRQTSVSIALKYKVNNSVLK